MSWARDHRFSYPFRDLREHPPEAAALLAELLREVDPGHPLHGAGPQVIARAEPQDDVIVETADGHVVLVHLTWSGHTETPPWPSTQFLESAAHLAQVAEY